MMIRSVSILFFIFLELFLNASESEIPEYEKYVNEIVRSFAISMENELSLKCVGDGGRMPYDVEEIAVFFDASRRATLEEARKLEIYAVDRLLLLINAHKKIRPFLREYPFTPERLSVRIGFNNKFGRNMDGTVVAVSLVNGNIYYDAYELIKGLYIELLKEPYAEAVKAVDKASLKAETLRKHEAKPYEKRMDELIYDFVQEVAKKWELDCSDIGGKWVDGIEEISFIFTGAESTSMEKARVLNIAITERLCEILNADTFLRPYFKEYPFTTNRIRNRIHFYRCYKTRYIHYEDGSIAYIEKDKDKFLYFTKQPHPTNKRLFSRVVPLAQEDYETAKKLVKNTKA